MNYGHRLRFALRLTTDADHGPGQLIQAAALAEQLGLDLLVIPAGTAGDDLEPSTVTAWIAGATVSLGLTVEAQPTLHPAMLARAVASPDRLTEGRVELALHAGPAAAGSGTAESDAALGEAIAVSFASCRTSSTAASAGSPAASTVSRERRRPHPRTTCRSLWTVRARTCSGWSDSRLTNGRRAATPPRWRGATAWLTRRREGRVAIPARSAGGSRSEVASASGQPGSPEPPRTG